MRTSKNTQSISERIQSTKNSLLKVNDPYNSDLADAYMSELDRHAREANEFISSLMDAFARALVGRGRFSEKQAYYLAKWMVENNI